MVAQRMTSLWRVFAHAQNSVAVQVVGWASCGPGATTSFMMFPTGLVSVFYVHCVFIKKKIVFSHVTRHAIEFVHRI